MKRTTDPQKNVVIVCGEGIVDVPSSSIVTDAIGEDDMEHMRQTLFASGNLTQPCHSINTDVNKRIRYVGEAAAA